MTDINDITRAQIDAADAYFRRKGGHHLPGGFFWCELLAEVFGTTPPALPSPAPAVPMGWKLVPIIPSTDMAIIGGDLIEAGGSDLCSENVYAAMLAAAPHAMQEEALTGQTRLQRACSDPTGWCPKCGCGHDRAGFAHLPTCNGATPPAGEGREALTYEHAANPCLQKLKPDEPFFVLLGRDQDAAEAVRYWADSRALRRGPSEKTAEARQVADRMDGYRAALAAARTKEG